MALAAQAVSATVRRTARVLCVDEAGRVLLLDTHWSGRVAPHRWITPGGGIEEGESEREAALRELFEETGQRVDPAALVGPIWHERTRLPAGHEFDMVDATYFLLRTPSFEVSREHWMPDEVDDILDVRWWEPRAIAASDDTFGDEDVLALLGRTSSAKPEPGDRVRVRGSKWHGTWHWRYDAEVLGTDALGVWLRLPAGTTVHKGTRAPLGLEHDFLRLVPWPTTSWLDGAWMLPGYWIGDPELVAYVDVSTPPSIRASDDGWIVEYVDLDLDLVVPVDGVPWLDDEDEFAERSVRHRWPGWVVERTRATGDALLRQAMTRRLEFLDAARTWAARLETR